MSNQMYPSIDLVQTGRHLQRVFKKKGLSVRKIQSLLQMSCPQPIYRWMKGQALPSVNHLYVLSSALHLHMEELLFVQYKQPPSVRRHEKILAGNWMVHETFRTQLMRSRLYVYWRERTLYEIMKKGADK